MDLTPVQLSCNSVHPEPRWDCLLGQATEFNTGLVQVRRRRAIQTVAVEQDARICTITAQTCQDLWGTT
eukprot:3913879-Lingulodinium_polyedra.AAC.1